MRFAALRNRRFKRSSSRTGIGFVGPVNFLASISRLPHVYHCYTKGVNIFFQIFFEAAGALVYNARQMATKPIPVRLDQQTINRLDAAAKRLGTNRSALIKFCTQTFMHHFDAHGGVSSLPPNWRELLRALDGRSHVIQFVGDHNRHITQRAAEEAPRYKANRKRR